MTSQHFDKGNGEWDWEDWGDNNNSAKSQQVQLPPVQQLPQQSLGQPQQTNPSQPIYSPFSYQQPGIPPQQFPPVSNQQPQQHMNPQTFFASPNDSLNNNIHPQLNQGTTGFNQPPAPLPQRSYVDNNQTLSRNEDEARARQANYQQPHPVGNFQRAQRDFLPSPSTSPAQLPPPPHSENLADEAYNSNQQMNLPAPPLMQSYEANSYRKAPGQVPKKTFDYQQPTWPPKPITPDANQASVAQATTPNWQTPISNQTPLSVSQVPTPSWQQPQAPVTQTPIPSWQLPNQQSSFSAASNQQSSVPVIQEPSYLPPTSNQQQTSSLSQQQHYPPSNQPPTVFNPVVLDSFKSHQPIPSFSEQPSVPQLQVTANPIVYGGSPRAFENMQENPASQESPAQVNHTQAQDFRQSSAPPTSSPHFPPQHQHQVENVEQFRSYTEPITAPPQVPTYTPQNVENFYPENREHLDDTTASQSASITDRHNYLVTGQLSQDRITLPHQQHSRHVQLEDNTNSNETLPPPGLSRMVVGQPESNQEQIQAFDVPPPGLNRMVTGTEMDSSNYNYQRQADGEVSQPPTVTLQRTQSPFSNHHHQSSSLDVSQQSFNTTDRNLYLVAGESDVSHQRVIPGVESAVNSSASILSPMQNLHIQDDVNLSVSVQERNVNVDGMETVPENPQISIDSQPRDEDIDGANDNWEGPVISAIEHATLGVAQNQVESDIREEAIEGANDEAAKLVNDKSAKLNKDHKGETKMSSEDSELHRLGNNKLKPKSRRGRKYTDDSNESENEYSENDKRDRNRRGPREKSSRGDYEKYRRREKDDPRYVESKRRTDDDDEDYRKDKTRRSTRKPEAEDVDSKERKKRDKYRESGSSRRKDYVHEEDRRERRRRERYYDDESYSGRKSQNTSDREYPSDRYNRRSRDHVEKDRSNPKYAGDAGYYPQQYAGYDQSNYNYNSYYQQQQYYETLRRTNPQAYYEWYTKYIAMMQAQAQARQPQAASTAIDDIGGSLKSGYSSSNEKDRRGMNSSFVDNTDYHSLQAYSSVKDVSQNYASPGYNQSYGYDVFSRGKVSSTTAEAQRSTPKKFQSLHNFVRINCGLMTSLQTTNAEHGYIVKIESFPVMDKTRRLYQLFPGPLVRGVSHKKTVIEFCEEKMKQDQLVPAAHRASFSLLWSYLILMLRQNGNYTEADISELLMNNSEEFKLNLESSTQEDIKSKAKEDSTDLSDESDENDSSEKNTDSVSQSQEATNATISEKVVLHKFRDYLLYGNINDALDFATDNNLWGHALFLASKVDRRQHANVMLKFANKLPYNDPLQTLYQIMSGRVPSCVSNLDDKWGDWRPHLAMIISNCTDKPDLVKRSIVALGDSLSTRGDIYGSQFCYLLAEPVFREYGDLTADGKLSLLGSSQNDKFKQFASDDAIIMTEVYEYARSLSEDGFFVPSIAKYKFLLATRMLDYGLQLKCLLYMEQIAKCIIAQPDAFETSFRTRIYSLADQLKYYDPVMEKSYEDSSGFNTSDDQKWLQDLASLTTYEAATSYYEQPVAAEASQPLSNDGYSQMNHVGFQQPEMYDPVSQHQTPTHIAANYGSYPQADQNHEVSQESFNQYQQQEQNYSSDYNSQPDSQNYMQYQEQETPYEPAAPQNFQPHPVQPNYDYSWDQNAYQPQQPQITMGNAVTKLDEPSSKKSNDVADNASKKKEPEPEKTKKPVAPNAAGGSGWFGGIFNKLSMKPKNQMILPDDKNPTILWDENTKKWVNKDGEATETESFRPPPKMGMMSPMPAQDVPSMPQRSQGQQQIPQMQQPIQQQQALSMPMNHAPQINSPIPQMPQQDGMMAANSGPESLTAQQQLPPTPAAPNMFKMQKGRNLKKSYVDILGNSGQTVSQPKDLAPPMDMSIFNPIQQQQQGMQFYNPNDFQ